MRRAVTRSTRGAAMMFVGLGVGVCRGRTEAAGSWWSEYQSKHPTKLVDQPVVDWKKVTIFAGLMNQRLKIC